eukprot:Rhum_TRINITY_DN12036_c0_g2::Rhum_TRINITY_DN12036_c0_g2_i1::g.48612::m.48612/K00472/P4HA; prolyl 4-hydroxylase
MPPSRDAILALWLGILLSATCFFKLVATSVPAASPPPSDPAEAWFHGLRLGPPIEAAALLRPSQEGAAPAAVFAASLPAPGGEPPQEYLRRSTFMRPAVHYPPANARLFATLSHRPRVDYFPSLLSVEECDLLAAAALPLLQADRGSSAGGTDSSASLALPLKGPLGLVSSRLANLTRNEWHEPVVVRRRRAAAAGAAHGADADAADPAAARCDYTDPGDSARPVTSNRVACFTFFLGGTAVAAEAEAEAEAEAAGGELAFPRAGGGDGGGADVVPPVSSAPLRVRPRRGAGVLHYVMRGDYSLDPFSLNGWTPVVRGELWTATVCHRTHTPSGYGYVS